MYFAARARGYTAEMQQAKDKTHLYIQLTPVRNKANIPDINIMATKVKAFPRFTRNQNENLFELILSKYANGNVWKLTAGTDFHGTAKPVRQNLRNRAVVAGYKFESQMDPDDKNSFFMQMTPIKTIVRKRTTKKRK